MTSQDDTPQASSSTRNSRDKDTKAKERSHRDRGDKAATPGSIHYLPYSSSRRREREKERRASSAKSIGRDDRPKDDEDRKRRLKKREEEEREAKSKARSGGSSTTRSEKLRSSRHPPAAVVPGAASENNVRKDNRAASKSSAMARDEKNKEKFRRKGSGQASVPGAVADQNVGDDDITTMSPRERSRRRKESKASGPSTPSLSSSSRRERRRREKDKEASMNAVPGPPVHSNYEEVPTASAIDDLKEEDNIEFEATSATDELEASRRQGSTEERTARQQDEGEDENKSRISTRKKSTRKYYKLIALLVLLLAAGVAAWFFLSRKPSSPSQDSSPTQHKDDCVAVLSQKPVQGQDEMTSKTFAVEINVMLAGDDVNPAKLQTDLAIGLQNDVLPALAGCDTQLNIDSSSIANAILNLIVASNLEACNNAPDSELLCSPVYMELNLYLKEDDESSEALRELILNAFQDDGLLEVLNLSSYVDDIRVDRVDEIIPSSISPSSSPSSDTGDPDVDRCLSIAKGNAPVDEDLALQEHDILLDVMLDSEVTDSVGFELEENIQSILMPVLAGCTDQGRRLEKGDLIMNAVAKAELAVDENCSSDESDALCYRYVIRVVIFVPKIASTGNFEEYILGIFRDAAPLVDRLGLGPPFVACSVVGLGRPSDPPTAAPSSSAGSSYPTLSLAPTTSPSATASQVPTRIPTDTPSAAPTIAPFPGPSPPPSSSPSSVPTKVPTTRPSAGPTKSPSVSPTSRPTGQPSRIPTRLPTSSPTPGPTPIASTRPSKAPTKSPSAIPTSTPSTRPTERGVPVVGDWQNEIFSYDTHGRYFLFLPSDFEAVFGSLPPSDQTGYYNIEQRRNGQAVYRGKIAIWIYDGSRPEIGIPDGYESGRRHPSSSVGDWQTGDIMVPDVAARDRMEKERRASSGKSDAGRDRPRRSGSSRGLNEDEDRKRRLKKREEEEREAKSKGRSGGSSTISEKRRSSRHPASVPGAVAENDARKDKAASKSSGSSRTRARDEKTKEQFRRKGSGQASVPGAVAEQNVGEDDITPMSPRERSRRRKESKANGSSPSLSSSSRRERRRREKDKEANMNAVPAPPIDPNQEGEVPTASAIDLKEDNVEFEATSATDELEASRRQGSEEERTERKQDEGEENKSGISTRNKSTRKYKLVALIVLLIAAGVTAWFFLSRKPSSPSQDSSDDCVAILNQKPVQGQEEMISKTFAVEINVVLAGDDVNPAKLQTDLAIGLQKDVLPALAGCHTQLSIASSSIANAILNLIGASNQEGCTSDLELLCSPVYMELNLYLKEAEESSEALRELILNTFQDDGLLEVLNLSSYVDDIKVDRVDEIMSSSTLFPSSSPSSDDGEPDVDKCLSIAKGDAPVDEDLALQEHDILLDVMLDSEVTDSVGFELEEKIQSILMPVLAGCRDQGRRLEKGDLIMNAVAKAELAVDENCSSDESDALCYRYVIRVVIFVPKIASTGNFEEYILGIFRDAAPLVDRLGLGSPFVSCTVVGLGRPSDPPIAAPGSSAGSSNPTLSLVPTMSPSATASHVPTRIPTGTPSGDPTFAPFPGPSPPPSPSPTKVPTKVPTTWPSAGPTKSPSVSPTSRPTGQPSVKPSRTPTTPAPTFQPSVKPSQTPTTNAPTARPSLAPSISPSTEPSAFPSKDPSSIPSLSPSKSYQPTGGFDGTGVRVFGDWVNEKNGHAEGSYFLFYASDWEAVFGSLPPAGTTYILKVEQRRNDAVIYRGSIAIWIMEGSLDYLPAGFEHGRRHKIETMAPDQWRTGDIIVPF